MGKKNKKPKGKSLSLGEFLGNTGGAGRLVPSKVNWADEEDVDTDDRSPPERIVLPTAPRQAREPNIDMERVPSSPPFIAYVANLPFEVEDIDIERFFHGIPIKSIRLPREGGENGRFKGFGYVEFDTKTGLLEALGKNEDMMRNRKIRVDVAEEENGPKRREGSNFVRGEEREDRSGGVSDWRASREPISYAPEPERRDNYGSKYGRGYDRDNKDDFERGSGGGRYDDRNRGGGRYDDWNSRNSSYGGKDKWTRPGGASRDDRSEPKERPKLQLKPRSAAIEKEAETAPALTSSSSIFGSAKPVDTASREQQMEKKWQKKTTDAPSKREVTTKDIFGEAKPVDTAIRERQIEDRLRNRGKNSDYSETRENSKVTSDRKKDYDEESQDSSIRSDNRNPSENNNDDHSSIDDENKNYDSETNSNEDLKSDSKIRSIKKHTNRDSEKDFPKRTEEANRDDRRYESKEIMDDTKPYSKDADRTHSPKRSDRRNSPTRNYNRSDSPRRNEDRDYSPQRSERRQYSPRGDRDYGRESSPRRSGRDYSPRRSDRDNKRYYSPKRTDRGYSPRRNDRRDDYSPRRSDGYGRREYSPRRSDRDGRRDYSPRRSNRDDRRDYSYKSDSSNRNEYTRSGDSGYRKFSPRRSDNNDRYSPRRYGRDDNDSYSYRRKDDDYANFSSRKPNRDRDNYGKGYPRDYGKSSNYDRNYSRNDDRSYQRSAPRQYNRDDGQDKKSSPQAEDTNRQSEDGNRNEVTRQETEDVPQKRNTTNCPSKVEITSDSNSEDKKLRKGKKKKNEDVSIDTTNKFAQLGIEEEV